MDTILVSLGAYIQMTILAHSIKFWYWLYFFGSYLTLIKIVDAASITTIEEPNPREGSTECLPINRHSSLLIQVPLHSLLEEAWKKGQPGGDTRNWFSQTKRKVEPIWINKEIRDGGKNEVFLRWLDLEVKKVYSLNKALRAKKFLQHSQNPRCARS